jgi:preprotein translocase subunit SecG
VKRILVWLIVAAVLLIGLVLYRTRSGSNLNVEPHAREVIEKAKRR